MSSLPCGSASSIHQNKSSSRRSSSIRINRTCPTYKVETRHQILIRKSKGLSPTYELWRRRLKSSRGAKYLDWLYSKWDPFAIVGHSPITIEYRDMTNPQSSRVISITESNIRWGEGDATISMSLEYNGASISPQEQACAVQISQAIFIRGIP